MCLMEGRSGLQGDVVRIELLFVGQRLEVGFDCKWDDGWRAVSEILLESLCFYGGGHGVGYSSLSISFKALSGGPVAGQRNNG